jgi:uncharacterized membrane protein
MRIKRADRGPVAVDVESQIEIARPREDVAAYASEPDNVPAWYENIADVTWESPRPLGVGTRIAFVAELLNTRLEYIYEVTELVPGERLVISTEEGPFPMETTYTWEELADHTTLMTLRNRGEPTGLAKKMSAPLLARSIRRASEADLRRLKQILEQNE